MGNAGRGAGTEPSETLGETDSDFFPGVGGLGSEGGAAKVSCFRRVNSVEKPT
jgi:hypothetical protein